MKKFDTFQEFMDWSVQKIVDQGGQCKDERGDCEYSDGKGKHCLIGWHLPESTASSVKDTNVRVLIEELPEECEHFSQFGVSALAWAQKFHDQNTQIARKAALEWMVNEHNLDPSPPQYQQWIDMGI